MLVYNRPFGFSLDVLRHPAHSRSLRGFHDSYGFEPTCCLIPSTCFRGPVVEILLFLLREMTVDLSEYSFHLAKKMPLTAQHWMPCWPIQFQPHVNEQGTNIHVLTIIKTGMSKQNSNEFQTHRFRAFSFSCIPDDDLVMETVRNSVHMAGIMQSSSTVLTTKCTLLDDPNRFLACLLISKAYVRPSMIAELRGDSLGKAVVEAAAI